MKRQGELILFFSILILLILLIAGTIYMNKVKNSISKYDRYYQTFGESCLDKVTDAYLRNVCEKMNNSTKRDACYYNKGISTGYNRICKLIENKTLKKECSRGVNAILLSNETLKQRAEKYNPQKRKI